MDEAGILVYFLIKALAYVGWCGQGARLHGHGDRLTLRAFVYGFVRLVLGLIVGLFLIYPLVNALDRVIPNHVILYFALYVPIRWFEWSLLAVIMDLDHRTPRHFLVGDTSASRLWRLGGIAISCVSDLPILIASDGLPTHGWC